MNEFIAIIEEHSEHFEESLTQLQWRTYLPSPYLEDFFSTLQREKLPLSEKENHLLLLLKLSAKDSAYEIVSAIQMKIEKATMKLYQDGVYPFAITSFRDLMEQVNEQARLNALRIMNAIYDEAKILGGAYPGILGRIFDLLNKCGSYLRNLVVKVSEFIAQIINDVAEWLPNAWASISNIFNAIRAWVTRWYCP